MFYNIFVDLCKEKKVSVSRAAESVGMNRAAVARWKEGSTPSGDNLIKLAEYFDVSVDYLLGKTNEKMPPEQSGGPSDDDIKVALFGGAGEVTDEMWEEAKGFVEFIKDRERKKRESRD